MVGEDKNRPILAVPENKNVDPQLNARTDVAIGAALLIYLILSCHKQLFQAGDFPDIVYN